MLHLFLGFLFALITAMVVIFGDVLIKIAADEGHRMLSPMVVAGCAVYAVSALFWFFAMRHVTLAQAGVAYSMLTLIALCAIGVLWFGETLHFREVAGIGCALAAMVLLARVA